MLLKIKIGYKNFEEFTSMKNEINNVLFKYINNYKNENQIDFIIPGLELIINEQRNLIATLLLLDNDEIYDNVINTNNKSDSDSHINTFNNNVTNNMPLSNYIILHIQKYEQNLTHCFIEEMNNHPLNILNKSDDIINLEKIITDLKCQISELKLENYQLQEDSSYVISNSTRLLINNNYNIDEQLIYNNSKFILDNLQIIIDDFNNIFNELSLYIKKQNDYINNYDNNKYNNYKNSVEDVKNLINDNIDTTSNKFICESLIKCSELIKMIGDISQDYQTMKNHIKSEMREEMKENYLYTSIILFLFR